MKYIKKFHTEDEYISFKNGHSYVEPHVIVILENTTKPIISKHLKPLVTLPTTLNYGENGAFGMDVYDTFCKRISNGETFPIGGTTILYVNISNVCLVALSGVALASGIVYFSDYQVTEMYDIQAWREINQNIAAFNLTSEGIIGIVS